MNALQKTQLTLLSEIDEICRENNLHYFLANEAALCAYRSHIFEGERSTANIYMPYADALALRKIIKSKGNKHRFLDSLIDNPNYPDATFRYCDEDTLYYHVTDVLGDCYRSHGIFVKICPLFKISNGKSAQKAYQMEEEWRTDHTDPSALKKWNAIKRRLMVMLLNRSNKNYSLSNKFMYIGLKGGVTEFPKNLFAKAVDVELEGKLFAIPQNAKRYFEILYSFNWMNKKFKNGTISDNFVIDDSVPYKAYLEHLRANNITCNAQKINEKTLASKRRLNPLIKPVNKVWNNVKLIVAGRNLADKYLPQKNEIKALYQNEDWQKIDEIFNEYEQLCLTFAASNQLLNFDDELLEILISLEQHKHNNIFAKKLKSLKAKQCSFIKK